MSLMLLFKTCCGDSKNCCKTRRLHRIGQAKKKKEKKDEKKEKI